MARLDDKERLRHVRRLLIKQGLFAPLLLTSILTTKAVAATKVVVVTSVPLSL